MGVKSGEQMGPMKIDNLHLVDHPLVQHKLTLMRQRDRSTKGFRELLNEIGMLLCYEVTRDLPIELIDIETPVASMKAPQISGKKLTLAPILRAGVGFLDGMLALIPSARVAIILMDPMLATGNSACAATTLLKLQGAKDIRFVCLLAAPEGVAQYQKQHGDVPIWTAAVDDRLNDHGYIVPGLGDAGDRMFGTR
jgi:uracil phosphoribosyltransferase